MPKKFTLATPAKQTTLDALFGRAVSAASKGEQVERKHNIKLTWKEPIKKSALPLFERSAWDGDYRLTAWAGGKGHKAGYIVSRIVEGRPDTLKSDEGELTTDSILDAQEEAEKKLVWVKTRDRIDAKARAARAKRQTSKARERRAPVVERGAGEFQAALDKFHKFASKVVADHYAKNFSNYPLNHHLGMDDGPKYIRIWKGEYSWNKPLPAMRSDGDWVSRSAWAFIDKANGDILKPAGWKAPAKHARGNIYDEASWRNITAYGPHYLK